MKILRICARSVAVDTTAMAFAACGGGGYGTSPAPEAAPGTSCVPPDRVSDIAAANTTNRSPPTDAHLMNPWGIAFGVQAFAWVANDGSSTSTLYDGPSPSLPPRVVAIPARNAGRARPTGVVFNITHGFQVAQGDASGRATRPKPHPCRPGPAGTRAGPQPRTSP